MIAPSEFLSTPSARRATGYTLQAKTGNDISIHALREEGDDISRSDARKIIQFLSTPSARRATSSPLLKDSSILFLSTPSARRATHPCRMQPTTVTHFYPRPPRGGRLSEEEQKQADEKISIHALREEGDVFGRVRPHHQRISIHALREEGDAVILVKRHFRDNFYPRPPRGGRPMISFTPSPTTDFYPRPPRGGRRQQLPGTQKAKAISIHALREEGDCVV